MIFKPYFVAGLAGGLVVAVFWAITYYLLKRRDRACSNCIDIQDILERIAFIEDRQKPHHETDLLSLSNEKAAIYSKVVRKKYVRDTLSGRLKRVKDVVAFIETICFMRVLFHSSASEERLLAVREVCKKDSDLVNDLHSEIWNSDPLKAHYSDELTAMQKLLDEMQTLI